MEKNKSSKLLIGAVLVLVGIGLLVWAVTGRNGGWPSSKQNNDTATVQETEELTNSEGSSGSEASETATITFTDDGFTPSSLTVSKGTTVTVKNDSSTRVQFSSDDHPTHRLNTEMNLKTLAPGESGSFVAETVGTHDYHDHIDDSMTGTLIVTE